MPYPTWHDVPDSCFTPLSNTRANEDRQNRMGTCLLQQNGEATTSLILVKFTGSMRYCVSDLARDTAKMAEILVERTADESRFYRWEGSLIWRI